jgi:hypothetical protein
MTTRSLGAWLGASLLVGLGATTGAGAVAPPDPCSLVPPAVIASVFAVKSPPASTTSVTPNASTCSYKNGQLTIEVGSSALTNPASPLKTTKVAGIPHGFYDSYAHTTQSQIVFYEGTAADGTYAVLRNFARIPKAKLIKVAKALNTALKAEG